MKVALLSESPADEAALPGARGGGAESGAAFRRAGISRRGWPNVAQLLPVVLRHLHFNTDTDVLVVVVDSDDSVVHRPNHDAPGYFHPHCRMCQLRAVYRQTTKKLPRAHGRERVLRAVGVAVPAIEAWYLCGRDDSVTEAMWITGLDSGRRPYSRSELKGRVYGTDRPNLSYETTCAVREVERHRHDTRRLESDFPSFAALANDLHATAHPMG